MNIDNLIEIYLDNPDSFLKIKETLTRIGIPSFKEKKLYQSCHILHKRGKYYIVHFKELFELDGKSSSITEEDIERRNTIACLIEDWGLAKIVNPKQVENRANISSIKVVSFKDKHEWNLIQKYTIGSK